MRLCKGMRELSVTGKWMWIMLEWIMRKYTFWVGKKAINWIKSTNQKWFNQSFEHNGVSQHIKVNCSDDNRSVHWWESLLNCFTWLRQQVKESDMREIVWGERETDKRQIKCMCNYVEVYCRLFLSQNQRQAKFTLQSH